MSIIHIAMLFFVLAALSACKAVTLEEATVTQPTFGLEAEDWGIPATDELRQDAYHARTPATHPAATVINTQDLHAQLISPNPPLTINVLSGDNRAVSIPGSIWLPAAGQGGVFDDDIQTQLASTLGTITDDDLARPTMVYCLDANCWLSYNAALRFYFIDYLNAVPGEFQAGYLGLCEFFRRHNCLITLGLDAADQDDILEKFKWPESYHNARIEAEMKNVRLDECVPDFECTMREVLEPLLIG